MLMWVKIAAALIHQVCFRTTFASKSPIINLDRRSIGHCSSDSSIIWLDVSWNPGTIPWHIEKNLSSDNDAGVSWRCSAHSRVQTKARYNRSCMQENRGGAGYSRTTCSLHFLNSIYLYSVRVCNAPSLQAAVPAHIFWKLPAVSLRRFKMIFVYHEAVCRW
jgi:hypothetical protein